MPTATAKPRKPRRHWALVGWWDGSPCAIVHGGYVPPFATWMLCDEAQWKNLRSEGYYTRLQKARPTAHIEKDFQKGTPLTIEEECGTAAAT